jgi:hypothetical protein
MVPFWLKLALHNANLRILIINNIRNKMKRIGHRQIETVLQHHSGRMAKMFKTHGVPDTKQFQALERYLQ